MAEENLQAFLLENAIKADEIEYVASPRFVSGGNPVPWKISPITNDENEALTNRCRRKQFVPGTRETRMRVDQEAYAAELICACVKYPNLNSEQLQSSYSAVGAADLVKKIQKDAFTVGLSLLLPQISAQRRIIDRIAAG